MSEKIRTKRLAIIPPTLNKIAAKRRLKQIVEQERIAADVKSWLAFFREDPDRIPLERLAQHIKAALTGRPLCDTHKQRVESGDEPVFMKDVEKDRINRLCDEINAIIHPQKRYIYEPNK